MPDSTGPRGGREEFWKEVIIPAARGLESFFWNLAWFALIVCLLFSFNPFRQGCRHEDRTVAPGQGEAVPEQPADQR
jgi:hypothetical protein